jgi:formylglycine-generating enzyme required for sulfatase activity/transcriptional regulator with XRE-family HTH domain
MDSFSRTASIFVRAGEALVDDPASDLGAVLRQLRLAARLSQRDLALRIGFHESGVQNIERGERAPSAQYLESVIVALSLNDADTAKLWLLYRRPPGQGVTITNVSEAVPCPYRGLFSFREEDAPLFFGRESAVRRIVRKIEASTLVGVVGASGSGKSSVVFAGVVPSLKRSAAWDVVSMRPGSNAAHAIAEALAVPAPDVGIESAVVQAVNERVLRLQRPLLIIIDQFEELYTHGSDEHAIARFLELLVALTRGTFPRPVKILLTFRGDFYGRMIGSRDFSDVLQDQVVHLPPMSRPELREAIAAPARKVGLQLEDRLVDRVLDDAGTEPGNLPLLEFALTRLWEHQSGRSLTVAAYEQIGRLVGAVTARAEEVYESLSPEQQYATRQLFIRLVQVARPEEDGNDARRRTPIAELSALPGVDAAIEALVDARLVVADADTATGPTVELAHEAIIRAWDRLRSWLVEDRQFLLWQQRTRQWKDEWLHAVDHDAVLLRGGILDEAERWLTLKGRESIAPDLLTYLDASIAEARAEARRQAVARIEQLLTVLPRDVADLALTFSEADEDLRLALLQQLEESRPRQHWRVRLALLANDSSQVRPLIDDLHTLWPDELIAVRDTVRNYHDWFSPALWEAAIADGKSNLAVAVLLADIDQADARWSDIAPAVVGSLVSQNQLHLRTYVDALRPVRLQLLEPLFQMYADDTELRAAARETKALILLDLGPDQPELLARMAAEALPQSAEQILAALAEAVTPEAINILKRIAHTEPKDGETETNRVRLGQRRAAVLCALLRLHVPLHLDQVLRPVPDPEVVTQFSFLASERNVSAGDLLSRLADAETAGSRYALLLALGEYARGAGSSPALVEQVAIAVHEHLGNDDAGVRAAALWLQRRWSLPYESAPRTAYDPTGRRTWFTVETGGNPLTFVVFRPGRFVMGSPADEAERSDYEGPPQDTTIARSFALCDREVTRSEFESFMADTGTTGLPNIDEWSPQGVEPVVAATWEEAMAYGQWCSAHLISMAVSRQARGRPSSLEEMQQLNFSLPTEAEWEYACRAGTTTAYSFGSDRSKLNQYGWFAVNSGLKTHEAGILRPNPAGLFNIHGQCWEWCLDWYGPYANDPVVDNRGPSSGDRKVLRGGCWNLGARYARSACRNAHIPPNRNYYISFRLAMSLPEIDQTWSLSDPNPIFWTGP